MIHKSKLFLRRPRCDLSNFIVIMPLPDFQMFGNRLRKTDRHTGKWARKQGISCFRIYDADIPEFPLAIDRYADYLHVAEYQRRHQLTDSEYDDWWQGALQVMTDVLNIPPDRIFSKKRQPQKGQQQYQKWDDRKHEIIVTEDGLQFIVNLSDFLDTGLFLDHRITRRMVRERAAGKRMLNLFAYTGSFTVYAAAGEAVSTLTIDLSNTYLDWAGKNLELNQLSGSPHRLLRADVKEWLNEPSTETFDLVVLDPPTFSNSKKMRTILDVQRDHVDLINGCLKRMDEGGVLFFSTNFRRFRMDSGKIYGAAIRDITAQTIPPDFRNKKIHYCYEITKQ